MGSENSIPRAFSRQSTSTEAVPAGGVPEAVVEAADPATVFEATSDTGDIEVCDSAEGIAVTEAALAEVAVATVVYPPTQYAATTSSSSI